MRNPKTQPLQRDEVPAVIERADGAKANPKRDRRRISATDKAKPSPAQPGSRQRKKPFVL